MNNSIYYFSGTGNSMKISEMIAERLGNTKLICIKDLLSEENVEIEAECIGFVYPVYFVDTPDFISDFIKKISLKKVQYVFVVVTCGGTPGNSLYTVNKILQQKGISLNYGYEIFLGDNSIVYHTEKDELNNRIKKLDVICENIVTNIVSGASTKEVYNENVESTQLKKYLKNYLSEELLIDNKETSIDTCSLCKHCIDICPTKNIYLESNRIRWRDNCLQCFACLNLCPTASIRFGKINPTKEQQYHYPREW